MTSTSGGLSIPVVVGIALGAAFFVIIVVLLVYYLKKKKMEETVF